MLPAFEGLTPSCYCTIRETADYWITQMADRLPLDPDRWERAVDIFERALELSPESREALIAREIDGDHELGETVRGMLASDSSELELIDRGLEGMADIATASLPDHPLAVGDKLGNFEVIGELGRGGMGVVYAARDRNLGRVAALKLLPARIAQEPAAIERLIAEAQAASALDHPNVATIYQVGEHAGQRFIAMARYEGETLRDRLARGPIPVREAVGITKAVAEGLAAAHSSGLVHRDVKPANIFLTRQGLVKLLDFAIATLIGPDETEATTRGTIRYMSPEQARRGVVDERSDLWSLGVVLFEMITGRPPIAGTTAPEVISALLDPAPVSLVDIPNALKPALSQVLQKNPARRTRTARDFISGLDRAIDTRRNVRRSAWAASALIAFASIGAIAWMSNRGGGGAPAPVTVAVLPLAVKDLKGDTSLAGGLIDEVSARLIALGRVRVLRTPERNGKRPTGSHYLELTLRDESGTSAVDVTLHRDGEKAPIWGTTQILDQADLRDLSRTLVIDILTALGFSPSERERSQIGAGFPSSGEAYAEFLRANRFLAVRTPPALESALVHYREAGELDSMYAGAFARQSYVYSVLVDWGWKPTASFAVDPVSEGLTLADRATRLDSTSADAWLARAYLLVIRDPHRFTGAVEAFQYAIALDPYNAEAFHQYGQTLTALGRYTEALAAYRRALDLEPDRAMSLVPMAAINKRLGRKREGLRLLDSAISAAPRVPYALAARSLTRSDLGLTEAAMADAQTALSIDVEYRIPQLSALARALYHLGDTAQARTRLEQAISAIVNPDAPAPTEAYWVAMAAAVMGRNEIAARLLRDARPRGAWLWFYFQGPELEGLRKRPDVAAILDEADPRRRPR